MMIVMRDPSPKRTLDTSPVQARNEVNLMIDIPGRYLIFQSSFEDEENLS